MSSGEALIKKVRTSTQKKFQSFIKCLNGKGHHFEVNNLFDVTPFYGTALQ